MTTAGSLGRRRLRLPRRARRLVGQVLVFALLLVAWEAYAGGVNRVLLAPPTAIAEAFVEVAIEEPVIGEALATSLSALAVGFGMAVPAGIVAGILLGRFRLLELVAEPYVWFLYALPSIALIPVFVIWFGIGVELRTFMVFEAGFFPMLIYTISGVKQVDPDLLDVGAAFGASERQIDTAIVLPSALPMIFSGIRIALGASLIGVIVVEMVVLITGLGGLIVEYANSFRTAELFVPIFVVMALSVLLTKAAALIQRRLTPWARVEVEELAGRVD